VAREGVPNIQFPFTVTKVEATDARGMVRVFISETSNGTPRYVFETQASGAPKVLDVITMGLVWQ